MTIASHDDARSPDRHPREGGGPRSGAADRRNRPHLRELCDEVLASFRVAREREVVSDGDRQAARSVLAELTPALRREGRQAA